MARRNSTQRQDQGGWPDNFPDEDRPLDEAAASEPRYEPSPHDRRADRPTPGSALDRALSLLETLLEGESSLGVQEICARLEMPRQSVLRMVNQLVELELLEPQPGRGRFKIGPRMRGLALTTAQCSSMAGPMHAVLEMLAERTGETCNLGILDQGKVLLIDRVESHWPFRVQSAVGKRLEPHASAIGRVLLAHLPKARRQQLLKAAQPLKRFTAHTIVEIEELEAEFATIWRTGFCISNQATTIGMLSLAVPVRNKSGRVIAGLACQAPFVRITMEQALNEVAPLLKDGARRIEELLAADA